MKTKIEKWHRWLAESKGQIRSLLWSRQIYRETMATIAANAELPKQNSLYGAIQMWYATYVLSGVRRQIKSSPQSISLARLLEDVRDNSHLISRAHWLALMKGSAGEHLADDQLTRVAGEGHYLDAKTVARDLELLHAVALKCETYSDKRISHHDRGEEPELPTYAEVDATLEELSRIFQKYFVLVTGSFPIMETSIAYNWKRVFDIPWRSKAS